MTRKSAGTDRDGSYTIDGLSAGSYRVQTRPPPDTNLSGQFYTNTTDWNLAAAVSVASGTTTEDIDFSLGAGGTISGTVYKNDTSSPVADAGVWANDYFGSGGHGGARTDEDGRYTITGLPPGSYRVEAEADGLVHKLYDDVTRWDLATIVTVTEGTDTPGIDFILESGGIITGRVHVAGDPGTPVVGANINASGYFGEGGWGWARTGADGVYVLDGLATGVYRVQADATDGGYARQYYSSTSDWDLAAQVSVTAGTSTYDIDFALQSGGAISGTARRSSDDTPIVGAEVWAETYVCCRGGNGARTDENGEYDITGLAPADYRVRLDASHLGLATQFFSSTDQWALADRVAVSSGTTTPDIDFRVAQGGSISGVVTGSGGIAGVNVWGRAFRMLPWWTWGFYGPLRQLHHRRPGCRPIPRRR